MAHYKSEDYLPTIKVKNAIVLNSEHLDSNYFHLLTEYIPVFEHLLKSNFNLSEFVIPLFLRGKKHPPKFVFEFFKLYGIPSRNIIFNEKPFILNADLIYSGITLLAKSRACFKQFSNRVLEGKVDGEKNTKLVICRENCGRTILNFQEFFPNFRRVFLERLSIREQAKLFNGSDEIVAAHGAGLTNLIFCQPGTVVTEFRTPQIANRKAYKRLAQSFKLNYKTEIAISENKKSTPTADMRLRPKRERHFAIDTDYDVDNTMAKTKHWTYGSRQIQSDIVILKRDTVFLSLIHI